MDSFFHQRRGLRALVSRMVSHLYFWSLLLLLVVLTPDSKVSSPTLWMRVQPGLFLISAIVLAVYFHFFILNRFFYKKRYLLYACLLVATVLGNSLWALSLSRLTAGRWDLYTAVLMTILALMITTSYKVMKDNIAQRLLLQEIQAKHVRTELDLLKSQINPHFLFNTLNNLYGLARRQEAAAADGIAGLSHLMRYMIYDSRADRIDLEKEVQQIHRFIELQKLRFAPGDDIHIEFQVAGRIDGSRIPPMLLIPFVENAFKHGISLSAASFIHIRLDLQENRLHFSIINSRHAARDQRVEETSGLGLQNVKRRLELLYPGTHRLDIHSSDKEYQVELTLRGIAGSWS